MTTTTRRRPKAGPRPAGKADPAVGKRAGVRMHPRIRDRRVAVTKEAGRKRLKVAGSASLVAILAVSAWGLTRSPLLDVDEVRATGAEQTGLDEIIARGRLEPGRAMVDVDPGAAAAAIRTLPWVATAQVERRWPGSLVVVVTERAPVAGVAQSDGLWALLDHEGRVLARIPDPPAGLTHIHDAGEVPPPGEAAPPELAGAVNVAAALPESLRRVVGGINLRPGGVELALNGGGVVRFGDPSRELAEKLRAAATVLNRVGSAGISVLDVTVPRAPVLARK